MGLVLMYFFMSVRLDVFQKTVTHLSSEQLIAGYFSFQQRIIGQIAQIGGYIYAPIVPMLAIIIWNYIQKRK